MKKKRSESSRRSDGSGQTKKSRVAVVSPITDTVLFGRISGLARGAMTSDAVVSALCAAHPEYRRMPSSLLLKAVNTSLRHLRETEPVRPLSKGGKDEDNDDHDDEEEEGDDDEQGEGRSNLMNATLRRSYSKTPPPPSTPANPVMSAGKDFEVPSARYSDVVCELFFRCCFFF